MKIKIKLIILDILMIYASILTIFLINGMNSNLKVKIEVLILLIIIYFMILYIIHYKIDQKVFNLLGIKDLTPTMAIIPCVCDIKDLMIRFKGYRDLLLNKYLYFVENYIPQEYNDISIELEEFYQNTFKN